MNQINETTNNKNNNRFLRVLFFIVFILGKRYFTKIPNPNLTNKTGIRIIYILFKSK